MTKLKTLKDLEVFDLGLKDKLYEYEQGKQYAQQWFKREAIDWLKELQFRMSYLEIKNDNQNSAIYSVDWIKTFFNISDEDL